jgi:hypothetical protein
MWRQRMASQPHVNFHHVANRDVAAGTAPEMECPKSGQVRRVRSKALLPATRTAPVADCLAMAGHTVVGSTEPSGLYGQVMRYGSPRARTRQL